MHLSISLPAEEAKILKRRAKRVYGGNVSRVVSDAIRYVAYEEGRDALIASFGGRGRPTPEEMRRLDTEWGLSAKKSACCTRRSPSIPERSSPSSGAKSAR